MKASACCRAKPLLILLALVLAGAYPAGAETLRDRLTATVRGVTYQLDIREEWEAATTPLPPTVFAGRGETHPGQDLVRKLSIHCIDNCERAWSYSGDSL